MYIQLFDELKELEAQPTWVLNQLIKKNIAWQDINAGHSGAEKLVEQKLHDEMLQKPVNLLNDVDAASE